MRKGIKVVWLILLVSCQAKDIPKSKSVNLSNLTDTLSQSSKEEFVWESIMCENKGYFETEKFTEKQLQDTYFLWYGYNSATILDVDVTLDKPEFISLEYIDATSRKLDEEYTKAINKLRKLDVVTIPFWLEYKDLSLQELEELYKLKKLTIEAHKSPVLLLNTRYSSKCKNYVEALAGEDSVALLREWRNLVDILKSNNGFPEGIERQYQQKLSSPERLLHAKIQLLTYGWWNCANSQRKYVDGFNQNGQMEKEFGKLFLKVESECDEEE